MHCSLPLRCTPFFRVPSRQKGNHEHSFTSCRENHTSILISLLLFFPAFGIADDYGNLRVSSGEKGKGQQTWKGGKLGTALQRTLCRRSIPQVRKGTNWIALEFAIGIRAVGAPAFP